MNLRKLIDLFEATANPNYKGTAGAQQIAQASGVKNVNRIIPGQQLTIPGQATPYTVKKGDTLDAIARRGATSAVPAAPATNRPTPSADNETLKGSVITKGLANTAQQVNQPATDTRGASAMASRSNNSSPTTNNIAADTTSNELGPEPKRPGASKTIGGDDDFGSPNTAPNPQPVPTQTSDRIATAALNAPAAQAPYGGAAANAMAASSTPTATQTSDQIATAALNAPTAAPATATDTSGAAAMASKSAPTQTSDQIATAALNAPATDVAGTSKNIPAAYGQMAEEEELAEAFDNMLRLSGLPLNERTLAQRQGVVGAKLAKTSSGQFMNRKDRLDQAKVDAVLGPGFKAGRADTNLALAKKFSQTDPTSSGDQDQPSFTGMQGRGPDSFTGMQGRGPDSFTGMQGKGPDSFTGMQGEPDMKFLPPEDDADTGNSNYSGRVQKTNTQGTNTDIGISLPKSKNQPGNKTNQSNLPSMYDVDKANRKEIASQFDPNSTYVNPYDKDTKASAPGSKVVNTMADFEEDVGHALAEMMRLSGLTLSEKAPPGKKAERMVKHIKKGYAKDGKLTDKEKSIAFATAWKQHNKEKVNEGMDIMLDEDGRTLKHIVNRFKHETKNFMNTGFMAENLYDALYDYYLDRGDMPYGIAKAREGDPYEWVEEHFYADMGSEMSEGTVAEQTVDPLSELARLAGLSEDGPGATRLYGDGKKPSGKFDPIDTMKQVANKGIDWYNKREQEKKDYWDSIRWADGSGGKPGSSGATADLLPRFRTDADTRLADKDKTSAPVATPAVTKADAFKDAMGSGSNKAQADDKLKEMGDSPLARLNQMPQTKGQDPSSGAASSFAPRERERVVSPKIDKYDKEKERAEKARRDIVDRESPDANTFGRKIGKAVSEPIAAIKSAWHGATDAWDHTMGNDTAPDPKPPVSVVNKRDWKGDKDNPALKENDELNRMRKIAGLQECGDMDMERNHMQQKDRLNVTTNMSSDGTKDVTINAQGDAAEDLLSMLKLAGMERHHKPTMVMIDQDEEMMDETGPGGQPFVPDDGRYIPSDDELPDAEDIFNPLMDEEIVDEAKMKRITRHSNTPDEEYQTVDSIIRQGNDLNREKRQYKKEYPGDNPMAESMLDQDLNDILESILIREEPIPTTKDPETGRVKATLPSDFWRPSKKRDRASQEIPMEPESPESRVTGPRSMKVPGERTGTENFGKDKEVDEGWEDIKTGVSDFVGDMFNTDDSIRRRSGQFRDLEAMQQKYKPGTPEYDQLEMRKNKQKERYYADQGEVVDKTGEPIKVLPPDQWKGGK